VNAIKLATLLALCSCVTGSQVVTGIAHPPVSPSAVKIYDAAPDGAEGVGLVSANSTASFSWETAKMQCLEKMREEAAAMGANGLVITDTEASLSAGQRVQARAIYVKQ
jgi:hypothetical protein